MPNLFSKAPRFGGGVPGVETQSGVDPKVEEMLLTMPESKVVITNDDVSRGIDILQQYKHGKANLEARIVEDELWYKLRHWEAIGKKKQPQEGKVPSPSSAWLFNTILNKHADAMDNYPEPIVLPRERSDENSAKTLSEVLPVILDYNDYEQVYSDNWWQKLKHGTSVYGVFWDTEKENGLGDICIREIDLLKLFWEPGIKDIQKSRNLFIVDLVDDDILEKQYPDHAGKIKGNAIEIKEYVYDDTVDTSGKSVVVDWYYKVKNASGKTVLHYIKFVGNELLYASENDPAYRGRGFYDHGLYPVVMDVMFPEEGTPVGFGYVAIDKDPQIYIDMLSANILENSMMGTKKRYMVSKSTAINKDEFMDWNNPIVEVDGEISDARIREIEVRPLDGIYLTVMQQKIEEMKETSANRDMSNGGTASGVTAAAAIAALQEAGNKVSRDMIASSYRAHMKISSLCIELIRQFYDEERSFRITAPNGMGGYEFVALSNERLRDQEIGSSDDGSPLYRRPVFDLKIKAQKKNPFSRMEQNENAKELYKLGFFNPDRAQESMMALEMMDFEGIETVREKVQEGQTLQALATQLMEENMMLKAVLGVAPQGAPSAPTGSGGAPAPSAAPSGGGIGKAVSNAATPMPGYAQALAKRSKPDMNMKSNAANPNG